MSSLMSRSSSLKVPINAARKRSGSFSETVGLSRSVSTERPGTPRPTEMVYCYESFSAFITNFLLRTRFQLVLMG